MAHAWNACWVNSPRGFKSPILRHRSPVLDSKTGDFLYPLVLFLQNPTVTRAAEAPLPAESITMIFKKVGDSRPYPQHGMTHADWGGIPPQQVRLDTLITTQKPSTSRLYSPKTPPSTATSSRMWSNGAENSTSKTACTEHCVTPCTAAPSCTRAYWTWTPSPRHYYPARENPPEYRKSREPMQRSIRSAALYVAIQPAKPLRSDLQIRLLHGRLLRQGLLRIQANRGALSIKTGTQTHLNKTNRA